MVDREIRNQRAVSLAREGLQGGWMLAVIISRVIHIFLLVAGLFLGGVTGANALVCAGNTATQGFIVVQALLARKMQKGVFLRCLAIYCLVGMIVTIVCGGMIVMMLGGGLLLRVNPDIAPKAILFKENTWTTLVSMVVLLATTAALSLLTRRALLQADRMLAGDGTQEDHFFPAAVAAFITVAVVLAQNFFSGRNYPLWYMVLYALVGVACNGSLGMLFLRASRAWNKACADGD